MGVFSTQLVPLILILAPKIMEEWNNQLQITVQKWLLHISPKMSWILGCTISMKESKTKVYDLIQFTYTPIWIKIVIMRFHRGFSSNLYTFNRCFYIKWEVCICGARIMTYDSVYDGVKKFLKLHLNFFPPRFHEFLFNFFYPSWIKVTKNREIVFV